MKNTKAGGPIANPALLGRICHGCAGYGRYCGRQITAEPGTACIVGGRYRTGTFPPWGAAAYRGSLPGKRVGSVVDLADLADLAQLKTQLKLDCDVQFVLIFRFILIKISIYI